MNKSTFAYMPVNKLTGAFLYEYEFSLRSNTNSNDNMVYYIPTDDILHDADISWERHCRNQRLDKDDYVMKRVEIKIVDYTPYDLEYLNPSND